MQSKYFCLIAGIMFFIGWLFVSDYSLATNGEDTAADDVIDRTVFRAGDEIVIDETIKGDLYAAARSIVVNGVVEGDLLAAANTVIINGDIQGDVRTAAQTVRINGTVGKNGLMFAQDVTLTPSGQMLGEVLTFSQHVNVNGTVEKHFQGAGQRIALNGTIGGDVTIYDVGELIITPSSNIDGTLNYQSTKEGNIAEDTVQGPIHFEKKEEQQVKEQPWYLPSFGTWISLISMFVLWLLLRFAFKPGVQSIDQSLNQSPLKSFGIGLLVFVATPILCILLLFTVVGIPVAIIIGLVFAILLYMSKVFIGIWFGKLITARFNWKWPAMIRELLGLILVFFFTRLPYVGWLISFVIVVFFLGALFVSLWLSNKDGGEERTA